MNQIEVETAEIPKLESWKPNEADVAPRESLTGKSLVEYRFERAIHGLLHHRELSRRLITVILQVELSMRKVAGSGEVEVIHRSFAGP